MATWGEFEQDAPEMAAANDWPPVYTTWRAR